MIQDSAAFVDFFEFETSNNTSKESFVFYRFIIKSMLRATSSGSKKRMGYFPSF